MQNAVRTTIEINSNVLGKNDQIANKIRGRFKSGGTLVLNVLSSPGSGKTALLEKTLHHFSKTLRVGVVVGDLATDNDAQRLKEWSPRVVPITTGKTCHLDASMVERALADIGDEPLDLLFIENVGNLICPSSFDLGEDSRVVLLSVTEGEDKPLKYPVIFRFADLVLVTKVDLAEAVEFRREAALKNIKQVAPGAAILELSAKREFGLKEWFAYIENRIAQKRKLAHG